MLHQAVAPLRALREAKGKPLLNQRVLVPRGGPWGDTVSALLREKGAVPVIAPLINFAPCADVQALDDALERLEAGQYDWLTVTSATTVDVLFAHRVKIPARTKVAAVGETTAAALQAMGFKVDLVPAKDNSAKGLAREINDLAEHPQKILALLSEIAKPTLCKALRAGGHEVDEVAAYRTVGVPVTDRIGADVANGRITAILVTSGSVAQQVRAQFADIPDDTVIAAIGPRTYEDAVKVGLSVDVVAKQQSVKSLIDALVGEFQTNDEE